MVRICCGEADLLRGRPEGADDYSLAEQPARPASGGTGEHTRFVSDFLRHRRRAHPGTLAGRSLKPLVHGKRPAWRQYLFTEFHVHSNHNPWPQRTVRDARFKLIYNPVAGEENPGYAFTMGKKFFAAPEAELLAVATDQVRAAYALMKKPPLYELYDLKADPFEFNNLADTPRMLPHRLGWSRH